MNRISIAEPCHENWAAMTPTERGAFCGKCAIDVIDFSGKSPQEIKQVLLENKGKHLCGRFKKTQLQELNDAYLDWDNQNVRTFQSKFLYACLIVFGMTLFSCNTPDEIITGQVQTEQLSNTDSDQNTLIEERVDSTYKTGLIDISYQQTEQLEHVKGKIAYTPIEEERYTKGEIIQEDIEPEKSGSIVVIEEERTTELKLVESEVFPNPAGSETQIKLSVLKSGWVEISLYTLSGEKIQAIYSGEITEGESNFDLDLSVLSNGTYLIQVLAHNTITTHKIVKAD